MEVKTCEEYVLKLLEDLQNEYADLSSKFSNLNSHLVFMKNLFCNVTPEETLGKLDSGVIDDLCIVFKGTEYEKYLHDKFISDDGTLEKAEEE